MLLKTLIFKTQNPRLPVGPQGDLVISLGWFGAAREGHFYHL